MVQIRVLGLAILFPVLLLAACAVQSNTAGQAVAAYFQALVDKDAEKLASLSCRDWEASARTELESFGAVAVTLEGLGCQESSQDGDNAVVTCTGKIIANYGNEILEINLADRQYLAVKEGGDWRMCGYH